MNKFYRMAFRKFIENILSVKVWIIFTLFFLSAHLVLEGHMTGDAFAAVNGGVISTVLAIREGIKVTKIQAREAREIRKMNKSNETEGE